MSENQESAPATETATNDTDEISTIGRATAEGQQEPRRTVLDEEGDIAADYLEELLDIADLDGDIELSRSNDRAVVEVVAEGAEARWLRKLVGEDGGVLDSLQELTRLAVQARTGERSRLMLDIAGHREHRRSELKGLAEEAIAEVKQTGQPVALEAMNPFERKVVHDAIAAAELASDSEGVEPDRHVVVKHGR